MSKKKNKLTRKQRRNRAAINRAIRNATMKGGGFVNIDKVNKVKNTQKAMKKASAQKMRERRKVDYARKTKNMETFASKFNNMEKNAIIRSLYDRGIKIQEDDYYNQFIDEHERDINADLIQNKIDEHLKQAEEFENLWDDYNPDMDPLG